MISRRQLMHESAIVAGGLAMATHLGQQAHAQTEVAAPATSPTSHRVLEIDLSGLEIGVSEYAEIPTGCTVFNFDLETYPDGVMLEADIRGGEPGYANVYSATNAISFAGGSVYGLEAATGAASELYAQSGYQDLITVAGAIIYDISVVEPPDGFRARHLPGQGAWPAGGAQRRSRSISRIVANGVDRAEHSARSGR